MEVKMNSKIYKSSIIALLLIAIPQSGFCQSKSKRPGVIKKKYKHACPGGTERVGEGPPKNTIVFCRQILPDGSRLEGDYTAFYRNGNKKAEGEYISGKKEGTWVSYYRGGQLSAKKSYIDGKLVEKVGYSKRGEVIKSNKSKANTESKQSAENAYYKSLRYKKSHKSTRSGSLGWNNRRNR